MILTEVLEDLGLLDFDKIPIKLWFFIFLINNSITVEFHIR